MSLYSYNLQLTPLQIPVFIALVMCSVVVFYSQRYRKLPLANSMMWAAGFCGFWVLMRLIAYATVDLSIRHYWHKAEYVGIVTLPVATLVFALHYTGRSHWVTRRNLLLAAIIPTLSFILLLTTETHGLMWRDRLTMATQWGPMPYSVYGPWFWVHTAYSYSCTLLGSMLILHHLWQSPSGYGWQAFNIILGLLTPIAANMFFLTKLQPAWLDVTPSAFAVTMALLAWDIYYLRLFNVVPIARRIILDMLDDCVIVLTHDDRIADMNPAAATILGVDPVVSFGSKLNELLPNLQGVMDAAHSAGQQWIEFQLNDAAKTPRWFQLQTRDVNLHLEGTLGKVIVLHDITEQKQNEKALAEARDEALAANHFKTQLMGKVSHELRTPLSVIMSYAELIHHQSNHSPAAKQQAAAATIIKYTRHLSRLVNDLLDTAQLEAGELTLDKALFPIQELVEHVIIQHKFQADAKNIQLTHSIDPQVPPMMIGDSDRLLQILNNLVGNAVKFTNQGTVCVKLRRPSECQWAIDVMDTGSGIPSEARTIIFEPFRQLENENQGKRSGYGLGLAIVYQLAKLMDGEVFVESEVGRGSTFTILLPLEMNALEPQMKKSWHGSA